MHASGTKLLCPAGCYYFIIIITIIIGAVLLFYNINGPACRLSPFFANLGRLTEKVRASQPPCSRCDAGRLAG